MTHEEVWSFGYGANMDIDFLEKSKNVRVIQHTPAVLKGYKLVFNAWGFKYVEPGFAGLKKEEGGEVHGIAFSMDKEGEAKLDHLEGVGFIYGKETVALKAYDGRDLQGFIYCPLNQTDEVYLPSARYLRIICKGAKQAGLDPEYINQLAAHPVYMAAEHPEVLQARKRRTQVKAELREIAAEELLRHKTEDIWLSCLGFVLRHLGSKSEPGWRPRETFTVHHAGLDVTRKFLMWFRGLKSPMQALDDEDKNSYPLVECLTQEEDEYLTCWLDHYHIGTSSEPAEIVGLHKEFKEQQESG